jgi:hypothetical protein
MLYGEKSLECRRRMNNVLGWKGNEAFGIRKGKRMQMDEENNVCKIYWKSECATQ